MNDEELTHARLAISRQSFADEQGVVQSLLAEATQIESLDKDITNLSREFTAQMREDGNGSNVEAFLHEYGLGSEEGVAVMCLAEALLRIPDKASADALIRNTFKNTEWADHLGHSDSLFVNASSWGLLLTGKVVNLQGENPLGLIGRAVGRLGEPVIRECLKTAMRIIGKQFVLGEDIKDALKEAKDYYKKGYRTSFDILGEGARSDAQAVAYHQSYLAAMDEIAKAASTLEPDSYNLSVKLSALHPRLHLLKREQLKTELLPRLVELVEKAKACDIRITLDAEEAARLDISLELLTMLLDHPASHGFNGIGYVVQAYQKRASLVLDYLALLAKRTGRIIPLRLVKGAYWDSEIKWAQLDGLPGYPVFTRKEYTDVSYLACATKLLHDTKHFYPQFATHNARTAASIMVLARKLGLGQNAFEFQRLHGMGETLHDQLVKSEIPCRIYGPVGQHRDLLAYLIRRLMENGANSSFVNLIMDRDTPMDELLFNPITKSHAQNGEPNPAIPLPQFIYGTRWQNSSGLNAAYAATEQDLRHDLAAFNTTTWRATPLVGCDLPKTLATRTINEPANTASVVGTVTEADDALVMAAMDTATKAFPAWAELTAHERAAMLDRLADLIEQHRTELMALCMREAGKTWNDAVAEVREAADFCRYYAWQARMLLIPDRRPSPTGESNTLSLHPRGVMGCISPWNFPLAIFTGQVAAAIVTGNCVLAKPAEQTPLVAYKTVQLFWEAGVPKGVLQLLPGDGATVGKAIAEHPSLEGIVFTGSVATAKILQRGLAEKDGPMVPLIAETGGLNCMVVDSSALLEQACDDIVLSAFGTAGQRCSALRLLYVQEDVADHLIEMIKGAMQQLSVTRPTHLHSDIGPVIDAESKSILDAHIADMKVRATFIASTPVDAEVQAQGYFVTPHAFELSGDDQITQEFFGPILHIIRFKRRDLQDLPARINAFGYGLTFGIHSRIQDHIDHFASRVHVGNIYVNRSMTGAVVGVQPFGGEGLSGTGPKAGGPNYLIRFTQERHITINTAAIGGDLQLLSQV